MKTLKIAIICGPENGSPKVLAETLEPLIRKTGCSAEIFYQAKAIRRLLPASQAKRNSVLWFLYKLKHFLNDRKVFSKLKSTDAVIICDWTPHGFYNDTYNIKRLKKIINKPVLYYAVQFLENSPTIIKRLKDGGHSLTELYDWHLTVSSITEQRGIPAPPWSQIGMNLRSTGLKPDPKKEFVAVVDFLRPGFEQYRETQIKVLEDLGVKYISLEKEYTLEEIRELYKQATLYFIQFPEAFGLPIAECLACGSYVVTADSSWPMSWRLDEKPEVHGPGKLPGCFIVYNGESDLKQKIWNIKENFDSAETPQKVFDIFYQNYPTFYDGNSDSLHNVLKRIEEKNI